MLATRTMRRRKYHAAVLVTLLLGLTGCSAGDGPDPRAAAPIEDFPILWQKCGTFSRINRVVHVVARDPQALARLPITEVPVDFKTQMVLIVGLGPTPTDELGVRIVRVWREGSRVRVQERRIHPGTEHSPRAVPASPWAVAVVPRSDLNVEGFLPFVPNDVLGDHPGAR